MNKEQLEQQANQLTVAHLQVSWQILKAKEHLEKLQQRADGILEDIVATNEEIQKLQPKPE